MMMEFSKKPLLPLLAVLRAGDRRLPDPGGRPDSMCRGRDLPRAVSRVRSQREVASPEPPAPGPRSRIVGADGYAPTDLLSGTVRMLIVARAATGVATVRLASGSTSFAASGAAAAAPLFAFDVDNHGVPPTATWPVTATVVAGDASTGTANGVLHVDNALPPVSARITAFSVGHVAGRLHREREHQQRRDDEALGVVHRTGQLGGHALLRAPRATAASSATSIANVGECDGHGERRRGIHLHA